MFAGRAAVGKHQGVPLDEEGFIILLEPAFKNAGHTAIGPMTWKEAQSGKIAIGPKANIVALSPVATALRYP